MWYNTALTTLTKVQYPIIQAGMAGGPTTPELVAAVCEAGALGSLGAGYLSPEKLRENIKAIQGLTSKPYAVNLFIPENHSLTEESLKGTRAILKPLEDKLGVTHDDIQPSFSSDFEEQFAILLEEDVPVFSFTFGVADEGMVRECHKHDIVVIGTATTVAEAVVLRDSGVDAIVAQGSEAGGHRGTFQNHSGDALIGTIALVPQMVAAVDVPVIASGGIMSGQGLISVLALGAAGAQLGTAFLTCQESGADPLHKERILSGIETSTQMTRGISGKWARGIRNALIDDLSDVQEKMAPYPITNQLTQGIRKKAKIDRNGDYMSLWAGQGLGLSRKKSVNELMNDFVDEANRTVERLSNK